MHISSIEVKRITKKSDIPVESLIGFDDEEKDEFELKLSEFDIGSLELDSFSFQPEIRANNHQIA